MNLFLSWIKNIFIWIFKDWKHVFIVVLSLALIILAFKYNRLDNSFREFQNQSYDTLSFYSNKIGEMYVQQKTYLAENSDLKKHNKELYDEVKNLKDNPIVVTKIKTNTVYKDKVITDTVYIDNSGNYNFNVKYKDQWLGLYGKSIIDPKLMNGTLKLDSVYVPNNITVDLIEKDKQLSFIAKSDNPYCKINSLNGSVISPENSSVLKKKFDKKWVIVLGVGPTLSVYNSKVVVLPGLQVTFGRKLFAF